MNAAAQKQQSNVVILHPAKPDPVFARIEAWQASEAAHVDAIKAQSALEKALSKQFPSSDTGFDWRTITADEAVIVAGVTRITSFDEINAYVDFDMSGLVSLYKGVKTVSRSLASTAKARKKALRDQLRTARIELKALQDKHGWTAVIEQWEQTEDAASRALRKLCDTKPTTIAGLAAMLNALQGRMEEGADIGAFHDGRTDNLFANLAAAAAALAAKSGKGL